MDAPVGRALARLHAELGFVPRLFHAQRLLPRLVEAEAHIVSAVLVRDGALPRSLKALTSPRSPSIAAVPISRRSPTGTGRTRATGRARGRLFRRG